MILVSNSSTLISLYLNRVQKEKVVLIGHPTLEEVRESALCSDTTLYSKNEIGFINPVENRWWRAMAEFVKVELDPLFEQQLPDTHYLFGNRIE